MNDYISKSALIEELQKRIGGDLDIEDVEYLEKVVNSVLTVDEKEIIRKPFERVVERLEEKRLNEYSARAEYVSGMNGLSKCYCDVRIETLEEVIEIVKEEGGIE